MNRSDTTDPTPRLDRRSMLRLAAAAPVLALPALARAQQNAGSSSFVPQVGQQGKDVIWVPTPDALVDRMLRMAQVGPNDFVVDLGSGDGKIVIAAARDFKARSLGVEFNPDMVNLARRNAEKAGVASLARFEQGDIFQFDYSNATVVTMYLLPGLNLPSTAGPATCGSCRRRSAAAGGSPPPTRAARARRTCRSRRRSSR